MFNRDFIDFIKLLNKHAVKYMVVGGYAVGNYGFERFTGDLDIWIEVSKTNARKMMKVVKEFPAPAGVFTESDFLIDKPLAGGFFGSPPLRIDILNNLEGVIFGDCFPNAEAKTFEGVEMKFIGFDDLIKCKKAANRGKDKIDIIELLKLRKRQMKNKK